MYIVAYSDASYKNSKGTWAGCITMENKIVIEIEEKIDRCHSVDYAELYGVYRLLQEMTTIWNQRFPVNIYTDSMSVVKWLSTRKEPRHRTTKILYYETLDLIDLQYDIVEINHINRNSSNYFFKNCHSRAKTININ
jgi:ribonuclease HI